MSIRSGQGVSRVHSGVGSPHVQQAIAYIEANFADCKLTQGTVANELDMSASHLASLFAAQTKLTFTDYLRDVRLDRAALLLKIGDASIKEVWAAIGYNDGSNFCHHFRDRFGRSPRGYRAGATHFIPIPTMLSPATQSAKADSSAPNKGGEVLIVDDNPVTRHFLARHLQATGYWRNVRIETVRPQ